MRQRRCRFRRGKPRRRRPGGRSGRRRIFRRDGTRRAEPVRAALALFLNGTQTERCAAIDGARQRFPAQRPGIAMRAAITGTLWGLAALALLATGASAQDASHLVRLYVSPANQGQVRETPADPDAELAEEAVPLARKADLELILWRRLGLSVTRQSVVRRFELSDGREVKDRSVSTAYNLTLYALQSRHNAFNLFLGGGTGAVEEYEARVDGEPLNLEPFDRGLPLRRAFAGIEYTFRRLGVRLEVVREQAHREKDDREADLNQTLQYLTFYIPFN